MRTAHRPSQVDVLAKLNADNRALYDCGRLVHRLLSTGSVTLTLSRTEGKITATYMIGLAGSKERPRHYTATGKTVVEVVLALAGKVTPPDGAAEREADLRRLVGDVDDDD